MAPGKYVQIASAYQKKVIKLFIYFIVDVVPITFIVMSNCKLFVVKSVVNFKYFPLKCSPMISGLNTLCNSPFLG